MFPGAPHRNGGTSRRRRLAGLALRLCASLGLLGWFLYATDLGEVWRALAVLRLEDFVAVIVLSHLALAVSTMRWRVFIPSFNLGTLFLYNCAMRFYAFVLPGQMSGDVVKLFMLRGRQVPTEKLAASIGLDRIVGFVGFLFVALVGIFSSPSVERLQAVHWSIAVALGALIVLLVFGRSSRLAAWMTMHILGRVPLGMYIRNFFERFVAAWTIYVKDNLTLLRAFIYAVIFQLLVVGIVYYISEVINLDVSYFDYCWIFLVVSIVTFIPISYNGVGLREGALILLLKEVGVSTEDAFALSLIIFSVEIINSALSILPLLLINTLKK